jgi:glycine/D-amino acid oxidase-like deaminating enzyme
VPLRYQDLSLWLDTAGDLTPRPPLAGDRDVDVAIVGAGYTGLWTAYYLAAADPSLRIAVLEAEIAGFGASGRNGGWCSALFPASKAKVARAHSRAGAVALQRAMQATIDEIGRVVEIEQLDIGWAKGGTTVLATAPSHVARLRSEVEEEHAWGFGPDDARWLEAEEAADRVGAVGVLGAAYTPHCAALHPGRLVRGLARAVERRGVTVHEQTLVTSLEPGAVVSSRGRVRAEVVVRATEGYTPRLAGQRRVLAPVYSLVIATEPLPPEFWDRVGWRGRETVSDGRHLIIYAQRTADDRIVFGGRGAPYHFGSRVRPGFDRDPAVFAELERILHELFPGTRDARITHRWGGPLGVPRDWHASVGLDRSTGLAWAGGYVGDGVATTNLAGRTLADLITGADTELTRLSWVGHRSRRWEPEPLRWLGINASLRLVASADRAEERTGRPARRATLMTHLLGG